MKRSTSSALAIMFATAVACQAAVVTVDGWSVIDNSFADDANGTYTETGSWNNVGESDGWGGAGNARWTNGAETATWQFLGLANGTYEVAVSWSVLGNRPTDVPYTVQGGSPFSVNQTIVANGSPTLNDGASDIPFELLTSSAIVSDGTLTVVLTDDEAGGPYAIADAVAIRQVIPEPATSVLLGLGGLALGLRRKRK